MRAAKCIWKTSSITWTEVWNKLVIARAKLDLVANKRKYGSGNSTLWYAERVKEIISVEHDQLWYQTMKDKLPESASIVYKDLEDGYVEEVSRHGLFDIIIIDGRKRPECAPMALQALKPEGVSNWCNYNRE